MLRPKRPDGDVGEPRKQAGSVAAVRVGALRFDRPRPRRRSPVPRTFGGEEARGQAPVRCSTSSRLRAGEAQVRPRTSGCKRQPRDERRTSSAPWKSGACSASVASWSLAIWCLPSMWCPGNRAGRRPVRETLVRQVFAPASSHRMHHRIGPAPAAPQSPGRTNNPAVVARDRRGLASMRPHRRWTSSTRSSANPRNPPERRRRGGITCDTDPVTGTVAYNRGGEPLSADTTVGHRPSPDATPAPPGTHPGARPALLPAAPGSHLPGITACDVARPTNRPSQADDRDPPQT